jgi:hypothetical protein
VVQCTWEDGTTGPVVGACFTAKNKAGRGPAWTNHPVVTVADPGRAFAVSRTEKGSGTIVWRYDLERHPDRTHVQQSYEVTSPVTRLGWFIIGTPYRLKDRRARESLPTGAEAPDGRQIETAIGAYGRLSDRDNSGFGRMEPKATGVNIVGSSSGLRAEGP